MTKAEIVSKIARETGLDKASVVQCLEVFMDEVKESLVREENVYLRGFGSFLIKPRQAKTARNISLNTTIIIPAHNVPTFRPAKSFLHRVTKLKEVK
jgi:DNA-binding protein HU-beta